ncbi:type III polyketide synthase [Granulicella tundricola]|uniref:Chalcone and stilbene synthase domain protein n=1 Tax=Granulicella tundricola (strain ATCC BAA-1859 / DSM 23138 / MP5ACTX9) TaxID=1198114 RepID=E8WZV9_GRATM|nr:3-oxoacyl-[acyl-carrier-protein] synthase III C-terminal domain-containing protein [Granulicella tundricola]ADW67770.1 chalcone and stilbene synthase domain protein [Granulicella tundricola MP5ACTX9]
MQIASVGTSFPPHRYTQAEIAEALVERWRDKLPEPRLLTRFHLNCGVEHRYTVLPLEAYPSLVGFGATNGAWITAAVDLGEQAITRALAPIGLTAADVSAIFFASVTGIASPTIDARLINRMPFPTHVKRTPIFGLGCVAGAAGIARASDYVRAFPDQIALLLSVELCSLTWQDDDQSVANLISTGLFGDGCAAVVIAGDNVKLPGPTAGPKILATRSTFYRHTEHVMGWDIRDTGFRIVLSPDVPKVVLENLKGDVDTFLTSQSLTQSDITSWIFHSGGPKVLEAAEKALTLPPEALALSWKSLREVGNLSAASVLCVLEDTLTNHPGAPGTYSILAAMGPAFCLELILLQW